MLASLNKPPLLSPFIEKSMTSSIDASLLYSIILSARTNHLNTLFDPFHGPYQFLVHLFYLFYSLLYPFVPFLPYIPNTSSEAHSLYFSLLTSYLSLLCCTQCWHNQSSYRHFYTFSPNSLWLSKLFNTSHDLYPSLILCTTFISHPPSADICDTNYIKLSSSKSLT